jgi:protoporphyrinogen oxidase
MRPLDSQPPVVIIGAGPAGLTAALHLAELGVPVVVVEANDRVGGLARTVDYKGFRFDIGGHRFYTKVSSVRELWRRILGAELLRRPRLSRIYFNGVFFDYPLKPLRALRGLGIVRSIAIVCSYLAVKIRPVAPEVSFEDWVTNRFGRRLYRTFFEAYTEKVWGIPCRTISARWAAQRIQSLSLRTAITNLFSRTKPKTLIDEFEYPRLGPGMMWEAFAARIESLGGKVLLETRACALRHDAGTITHVQVESEGRVRELAASHVIATIPLTHLVHSLGDQQPHFAETVSRLKYRDFITVAVIVDRQDVFPDNWIYIHDPSVRVGRIQNFKNWSPDMVPDASKTCLGLEYFCTTGDDLWSMSDAELIALARQELGTIGLVDPSRFVDGHVVRVPHAYPVYDQGYEEALQSVREYLAGFANLQTIGRNGTHTYNNQDHSMVMGMLAVRNLFGEKHDLWAVDSKDEYLEQLPDESLSSTPALHSGVLAATERLAPTLIR